MKKIYNKENVDNTFLFIKKRFETTNNRSYRIQDIISAFNKLPGKYQDLLLKINKDENDKADLVKVYGLLRINLTKTKDVPEDIEVNIKNIDSEEEVKKASITMDDIETSGDRWERLKEKKEKQKEEKTKITNKTIKIDKEEQNKSKEKDRILKEYIAERKGLKIKELLVSLDIPEIDYYIILEKFKNNSVKDNKELEKEINIASSYIDEVIDRFYERAITEKKTRIYTLERK